MTTALFFHADRSMLPRYAAALPGSNLVIVNSPDSQFSAGYDERTGIARRFPTLPALLATFAPAWKEGDPLVLIGFSAGCWALRAYLREPRDRAKVKAAVFLDGLHSSGSHHAAERPLIEGVLAYAAECRRSPARGRLIVTHTQIVTVGYASTSATADLVCVVLGEPRASRLESRDFGAVRILAYPGGDASAHAHQLRDVGPIVLKEHVAPMLVPSADALTLTVGLSVFSLGERAVEWSLAQYEAGVQERPPGSNSGPEIRAYFAPCKRRGTELPLHLTSGDWCCAGACAAMMAAAHVDEELELPHGYRAAVVELVADMAARGLWWTKADVEKGKYTPRRGDLAVFDRSTAGAPATAWYRHISRIVEWREDRTFTTVGANEGNRWQCSVHALGEATLLGFGMYPAVGTRPNASDQGLLASLTDDLRKAGEGDGMQA